MLRAYVLYAFILAALLGVTGIAFVVVWVLGHWDE